MYVGMGKSKGLEFTKSFKPFSGKGLKLKEFWAVWGHLGVPSCYWLRALLKAAFSFFLKWTVYFLNLGFLFCCQTQPYHSSLSLNLAFSSQEQSCSCLCRSKCVPSPICSHVNPCLSPFWAQSFSLPILAQPVTFWVVGHSCPSVPAPDVVAPFHVTLFLEFPCHSHWPWSRMLVFSLILQSESPAR